MNQPKDTNRSRAIAAMNNADQRRLEGDYENAAILAQLSTTYAQLATAEALQQLVLTLPTPGQEGPA